MDSNKLNIMGFLLIIIPIVSAIGFLSTSILPDGYDLAIDGYIISRTLVIIYILNSCAKFGYYLLTKNNKNNQ